MCDRSDCVILCAHNMMQIGRDCSRALQSLRFNSSWSVACYQLKRNPNQEQATGWVAIARRRRRERSRSHLWSKERRRRHRGVVTAAQRWSEERRPWRMWRDEEIVALAERLEKSNRLKRLWKENEHACADLQFIDEKNRPRCASISVAEALRTLELLRRILHQSFFWLMLNRLPIKLGLAGDDGHSVNHVDWIDRWAIVVGPPKNHAGQIDEGWSVLLLRKTKKTGQRKLSDRDE